MLRLAGLRINPRNNGPRGEVSYKSAELIDLNTLRRVSLAIPAGARIGTPQWGPDGKTAAFATYFEDRIELLLLNTSTGALRTVPGVRLNAAFGDPMEWMADSHQLLAQTIPAGRGAAPAEAAVPAGPDIQESLGKAAPAPTFQDLLKSEHDERLFDYYCTSQITLIDTATGRLSEVGRPAIFSAIRPSPDGTFILTQRVHRPYSWVLPAMRFPVDIEVWRAAGGLCASWLPYRWRTGFRLTACARDRGT